MSRFNMNNLQRLGNQFNISLSPDEDGYLGRECPVETCEGYFKITPGTGVNGPAPCHCPYCGHTGEPSTFHTKEQIEYAKSLVIRQVTDALFKDMKSLEFDHKPRGGFGIGLSLKVTRDGPRPIRYYREKELETHVVCDNCTLRYAIYGVFGWCPDCRSHNSLQILSKNLELAKKELALAETAEKDLADHLVGDALENVVSAFDGFGRAICQQKGVDIRFQNLAGARRNVQEKFGFDLADGLTLPQWEEICRVFQKRHLLSHRMGVVDEDYLRKTNDPHAVLGRKITVTRDEVVSSINLVEALGRKLFSGTPLPTI